MPRDIRAKKLVVANQIGSVNVHGAKWWYFAVTIVVLGAIVVGIAVWLDSRQTIEIRSSAAEIKASMQHVVASNLSPGTYRLPDELRARLDVVIARGDLLDRATAVLAVAADAGATARWSDVDREFDIIELARADGRLSSDADTARFFELKGDRYFFGGQSASAILWFRKATALSRLPELHYKIARAAMSDASIPEKERWIVAVQALEIAEQTAGNDTALASLISDLMAFVHVEQGHFEVALKYARRAMRISSYASDADMLLRIGIRLNLATVERQVGNFAIAEEHLTWCLAMQRQRIHELHPSMLGIYVNLAMLQQEVRDYVSSLDNLDRAMSICEQSADCAPQAVAIIQAAIAVSREAMGDSIGAAAAVRRAEECIRDYPCLASSVLRSTYERIGTVRHLQRDYGGAIDMFEMALDCVSSDGQAGDAVKLPIWISLSAAHFDGGNLEKAEEYSRKVIQLLDRRAVARSAACHGTMYINLASTLGKAGRIADATSAINQGMSILQREFKADHPVFIHAYTVIASLFYENGQLVQAIESVRNAITLLTLTYRRPTVTATIHMAWMGCILAEIGKCSEARSAVQIAIRDCEAIVGRHHIQVGGLHIALARVELECGYADAACKAACEALRIVRLYEGRNGESERAILTQLQDVFFCEASECR